MPILLDRDIEWDSLGKEPFTLKNICIALKAEPGNAKLHLALALVLNSQSLPSFLDDAKYNYLFDLFREFNDPPEDLHAEMLKEEIGFEYEISDIKSEIETALALGLDDYLLSAKARLFLISVIRVENNRLLNKKPEGFNKYRVADDSMGSTIFLLKEVLKDLRKLARINPYHIEGLIIQKVVNNSAVGSREEVAKANIKLRQARALQKMNQASQGITSNSLRNDGIALEELAKSILSSMGLKIFTTKITGDGGIDLVAYSDSAIFSGKYIVQCKDWQNPVGEPIIRDLYGLVMSEGANKGIVITTGSFTSAARKFAEGKQLELIDGDELTRLKQKHLK